MENRKLLHVWFQAVRPFSFTASTVPAVLGAAWAAYEKTPANWLFLPLIVIASVAVHAATNLVSDYFDFVKGVDKGDTFGGSRVIVEGKLAAKQVLIGGFILFAMTAAIGLVFIWYRGWPILVLGGIGMLGGLCYTAFKYHGLGDIAVFVLMGPLMVIGSYFVLTGAYNHFVFFISLPIGCLVAAILSGNNLRDILQDNQAGIRTTAGVLGHRFARIEYSLLDISAFVLAGILIALKILPAMTLATFLTLPLAVKLIQQALASHPDKPETIATLDVQTAQLHLAFGVLLIASLFGEAIWHLNR
jgi:1,4-dihydroxy-2-naphthoate octaprenyltransferase